jgi:hypothetical protein
MAEVVAADIPTALQLQVLAVPLYMEEAEEGVVAVPTLSQHYRPQVMAGTPVTRVRQV